MLQVNIVGIGPGNPELLTVSARHAIEKSTILIGDKRMLAIFADKKKTSHITINPDEIELIVNQAKDTEEIAVLVSGDVGFFSLAKSLSKKLSNCNCTRYCGISSLVYFASKLEMSWEDAKVVSMHGRCQNFVNAVAQNEKVFSLTGGENTPQALCKKLCTYGLGNVKVYVGENLSYMEEKITFKTAKEISTLEFSSLSVMMILNPSANKYTSTVHGLDDSLFIRSKVPMTKQEIRSISISKLQPKTTDLIYDIGAGTGSCSIELALLAKKGQVWAFERNPLAIELLQKNKQLFSADNLEIIEGEALENIKRFPPPDCVFIGGSGGDLAEMLDIIYQKNNACRIVINAITVETLAKTVYYYDSHNEYELEIINVFVAHNKNLGNYNLMMAQNPIYVMVASKKEDYYDQDKNASFND